MITIISEAWLLAAAVESSLERPIAENQGRMANPNSSEEKLNSHKNASIIEIQKAFTLISRDFVCLF